LVSKAIEFGKKTQNKGCYAVPFKVIQGHHHRGPYQSKARMRLAISD